MKRETENAAGKPDILLELLDWLKYILIAVLIGLLLVVFVIQRNSVIGDSMVPNLHQNDQLLVEKISKLFDGIHYGDIITIKTDNLRDHEGGPNIIKRVIGLPGDTIEIRADGVYRNDSKIDESAYLPAGTTTEIRSMAFAKVTLADDEYYVMGDNRPISLDSRSFGPVPLNSIIGRVLIRFYPFASFGSP
jgi:signal peptidase I